MTAFAGNGQYIPHGVNESNIVVVAHTLAQALAAGDTLDLTLPAGVDKDFLPSSVKAFSTATPAVELTGAGNANLSVTNHNRSTGVTRLTAAGAGIAISARLIIWYSYAAG
jgi:hypothetical protein